MPFSTADYVLAVIPLGASTDIGFGDRLSCFLDDPLLATNKLPQLDAAPISSWLLARLRRLDPVIPFEVFEECDGGGYCLYMAAAKGHSIVATFQLQGDIEGVVVVGSVVNAATANDLLNQLVSLLVEAPEEVSECCHHVVDPEWELDPECYCPVPDAESENEYGWSNGKYLGACNI